MGASVMAEQHASAIIGKVWGCNILRDDGVNYGDYLELLAYGIVFPPSHHASKSNPCPRQVNTGYWNVKPMAIETCVDIGHFARLFAIMYPSSLPLMIYLPNTAECRMAAQYFKI
jgi:hypothetical protein